jgi:hypothetical protein
VVRKPRCDFRAQVWKLHFWCLLQNKGLDVWSDKSLAAYINPFTHPHPCLSSTAVRIHRTKTITVSQYVCFGTSSKIQFQPVHVLKHCRHSKINLAMSRLAREPEAAQARHLFRHEAFCEQDLVPASRPAKSKMDELQVNGQMPLVLCTETWKKAGSSTCM